jgi:cell division protein FtsQ
MGNQLRSLVRLFRAFALLVVFCGLAFATQQALLRVNQPIKEIQLGGEFDQSRSTEIEADLEVYGGSGLMSIDLDRLKVEIETTPWVARARISRQWPNTLVVDLEEHRLVARWNQAGYVSDQGRLVQGYRVDREMPLLQSTAQDPLELLQQYRSLSQAMSQIDLQLSELRESRTGDLDLLLDNGILLKLGSRDLLNRIQRFIAIWQLDLKQRSQQIQQIDVRYANGLAVNWNRDASESEGVGVQQLGELYGELARR